MDRQVEDGRDPSRSRREADTFSGPYPRLTFIDISNPEAVRDRSKLKKARVHAITVALAKKRFAAQAQGKNFRLEAFHEGHQNSARGCRQSQCVLVAPTPAGPIGPSSIDPFETLSVNARRLTILFHLKSSRRAGEPIFNVNDAIRFQTLQSIFDSGLSDGALTASLSLTLSLAATGWQMSDECIKFNSITMQQIRRKLSDPVTAVSSATMGAVLLLVGIAYRLGELQSAKAHITGLRTLLRLCTERHVELSPAMKRAIYWQDLFSSIFVGTDRIVAYEGFYPSQHLRLEHMGRGSRPPCGFVRSSHFLSSDFLDVAAEVATLYANRGRFFASDDPAESHDSLDNAQAQLEGRIHNLRRDTDNNMLICCILATQLCVYGFWDSIWNAALIPRELSTKMLYHLRCCQRDDIEDDNLYFWLVNVGKAFAIDVYVRDELDRLWLKRCCNAGHSLFSPWEAARCILSSFIWSDVLYSETKGWFWESIEE